MDTSPEELFISSQNEVVARNEKNASTWSTYKEDLKGTQALLKQLPEKLSHNVMVPLGSKAMIRGKIVHTNEFLVSLGDTYFVKRTASQSWDICERKIKHCDEMLSNLEKERSLYENKLMLPNNLEAFGSEEHPEILEYVTADEDREWREVHREREKEYRRKLAEAREKGKTKVETEEDLWQRLDELELEEELEDELQRLRAERGSESEEGSEEDEISEVKTLLQEVRIESVDEKPEKKRKKSVIFIDEITEETNAPLYLNFKHSEVTPKAGPGTDSVLSPGDIYPKYLLDLREAPSSILKVKRNPNSVKELANISGEGEESDSEVPIQVVRGLKLPEVTERRHFEVETVTDITEKPKKMSKFKESRLKRKDLSGQ